MLPGIDCSRWNGVIDWALVAQAGIRFAFLKATEGAAIIDPMLHANAEGCAAAGIPVGLYHFFRLPGSDEQIRNFVAAFRGIPSHLQPALDLEIGSLTEETQSDALAWMSAVEKELGVKPMLYTSPGFADVHLSNPAWLNYPLWVAHYTNLPQPRTSHWQDWAFWQHTAKGEVDGIKGYVDLDWLNGDDLGPWLRTT